jgi:hypothetical protein
VRQLWERLLQFFIMHALRRLMFGYADKQKRMTSPPQAASCSAVPTAEPADESEVVAAKMAMARLTWHKVDRRRWLA